MEGDLSAEDRLARLIASARAEPDSFAWVDERGPGHWDPVLPGPFPVGGKKMKRGYIVAVYCCVGTIQTCRKPL
eukprot:975278-Alexandrium_andersonii.AAC.1